MSSIPKIVLHDPEGHRHEILRERVADDSINVDETPATKSIGGKVQLAGSVLKLVSQMCFTTWNERYLVLQGGYIFKFDSPQSSKQKGSPIELLSCQIQETTMSHQHFVLSLSTIRKDYCFAFKSSDELATWVNAIKQAQTRAVRRSLGHEKSSNEEQLADSIARDILDTKQRIEEREASREVELSNSQNFY
eukprot:TRINITY_DN4401_c0_g1_i1.p1 TRINITY_DN4401_c0_g1~~TRINITY_DN4401_c0_g1_i1.p1  ORF type:complete len:192 (-),score=39.92 TRINITY_DN4401_c0_g1_i1:61-636(-)